MATPESIVKKEIKAYLDSIGAYYFMPVQMGYGAKTLDFLCCVRGRFVAIEAKRPGKDATAFQLQCMREMDAAGALTMIATNAATVLNIVEFSIPGVVNDRIFKTK